jgi:predicted transcriptional regulator of viral defense system
MQPIKQLATSLDRLFDEEHFLFSLSDLSSLLPELSTIAFKALIGRAVKNGLLKRVCRGIYLYPLKKYSSGLILYRAAARLRAHEFNYLSLESVLSDAGVISQIPMNWITLMSSGRTHTVDCGVWGHIEFIHTKRKLASLESDLYYDTNCGLWRCSVSMALLDMKYTRRNMELVDWGVVHEII